jgi:hypothetical protein
LDCAGSFAMQGARTGAAAEEMSALGAVVSERRMLFANPRLVAYTGAMRSRGLGLLTQKLGCWSLPQVRANHWAA